MNLAAFIHTNGYIALQAFPDGVGFLDKLGRDGELDDAEKNEFLAYMGSYDPATDGPVKNYCESWLRQDSKKFLGEAYPRMASHVFMRVNDVSRFKTWVNSIAQLDISPAVDDLMSTDTAVRSDAFSAILDTPIKDDIVIDVNQTEYYMGPDFLLFSLPHVIGEAKTAGHLEWGSPWPEDEDDLFSPAKLVDVDCRMGLSANRDEDKIVYKHDTSSCSQLRRPTVFDAEFYDQFQPGGKTVPLAECNHLAGFDEYVHTPNRFKMMIDLPEFIIK